MKAGRKVHLAYAGVLILTLLVAPVGRAHAEGTSEQGSEYPVFTWAHWHLHRQPSSMDADQWHAELMSLAAAGDPEAQYLVGQSYEHGRDGLAPDQSRAIALYRLSAEGGYAFALERLGLDAFRSGAYGAALPMLLGAARMGLRGPVTDALAEMYDHGWGVPLDRQEACYWRQFGCGRPKPAGPVIDLTSD